MLIAKYSNRFLIMLAAALLALTGCNEEAPPRGASTPVGTPIPNGSATNTPLDGLVKWQTQLGDITVEGGLVVSNDTVYVVTEHFNRDDFRNLSPCLCALDAQTGVKKWAFKYAGSQASAPTVSEGAVFFSVLQPSPQDPTNSISYLYALDARTGKEKWHFQTGSLQAAQPLVQDGIVYFASLRDRHLVYDSTGNIIHGEPNIYALRVGTGELIWKEWINADSWTAAAIDKGTLYFAEQIEYTAISENIYIRALDLQTHTTKWQFKIAGRYSKVDKLIVANNMVYFTERYRDTIRTLDAETGELRWTYEADTGLDMSRAVGKCCKFSWSKAQEQAPQAFSIQASAVFTSYAPPQPGLKTLPEVAGDTLVVGLGLREGTPTNESAWGDMDGYVLGLDAATGKERWHTKVHRVLNGWPALKVRKEIAYLVAYTAEAPWEPSGSTSLYALDTRAGSILWKLPLDGLPSPASMEVSNTIMIATGWRGEVYGVNPCHQTVA